MNRKTWIFSGGIFVLALLMRVLSMNFVFGDYDEGVYIATLRSIAHGFPLIAKTYSSQFPLFFYMTLPVYLLTHNIVFLRLVVALCSLIIIVLSYFLVSKYVCRRAAYIVCLYLAVNSIFLTVSRTFQLDIPWLCFTTISFFFLLLFHEKRKYWQLIASALAFAASILIKASPLFIPVLICYACYLVYKKRWQATPYLAVYALISIACVIVVITPSNLMTLYHEAISIRGASVGFPPSVDTLKTLVRHEWIVMFLALGSVILFVWRKEWRNNVFFVLSTVWLATTSVVFLFYNELFYHHLVFFILPCIFVGVFCIEYIARFVPQVVIWIGVVGILIYSSFVVTNDISIIHPRVSSYDNQLQQVSIYVKAHASSSNFVISDDQLVLYLANRNTPPDEVDTSNVRIQHGQLSAQTLIHDTETYHVKVVVLVSGRLVQIPAYVAYLRTHYQEHHIDGASVYVLP
jgi:hypothetical protein